MTDSGVVERSWKSTKRRNYMGQQIGSKGARTRRLLIETTVRLLDSERLRDVSVSQVAREAGTSPATFYVYFRDVPEVVLAALEGGQPATSELEQLLRRDWLAPGSLEAAREVIEQYTALWDRNRTIFRVRNLAAEEGDLRFYSARIQAAEPVLDLLSLAVERAQKSGRVPDNLAARSCAATILMLLERLCAVGPMTPEANGLSFPLLKEAAAHQLLVSLGGQS